MAIEVLGNLVKIKGGKRLPKGATLQTQPNSHPYIRVRDMGQRYIPKAGLEFVPDSVFPKIQRYIVNKNDLILSIVGSVGLVSIIDESFDNASQTENCAKLSGLNEIDSKFLYYYLISELGQNEIRAGTVGAVQPKLPLYSIEKIKVFWPEDPIRKQVASVLSSLDDKIAINQRINQTLEAMAQGLFKSWFVDFEPTRAKMVVLEAGRTSEEATLAAMSAISCKSTEELAILKTTAPEIYADLHTTAELFPSALTQSELGLIPEGWEVGKIEDVLELAYGKALKKTDRRDGDVPVYGSGGINGSHNKALVSGPGIIVGRKGTVGSIHWENRDFFPIDTVFYVVPKKEFSLSYSYQLLKTQGLKNMNTDAAVPGLNRNNVYRLEVVLPSPKIINAFNKVVELLYDKVSVTTEESQTLTQLRDSLLPKLLSGEISVDGNSNIKEAV